MRARRTRLRQLSSAWRGGTVLLARRFAACATRGTRVLRGRRRQTLRRQSVWRVALVSRVPRPVATAARDTCAPARAPQTARRCAGVVHLLSVCCAAATSSYSLVLRACVLCTLCRAVWCVVSFCVAVILMQGGVRCACASRVVQAACPIGRFSLAGATLCGNCSAGFLCPVASNTSSPSWAMCPAGTFSLLGATSCSNCSAGYACLPGSTNSTPTAQQCPGGRYSESGAVSCTNCSAGYACPAGSTNSTPTSSICTLGRYSFAGFPSCLNCTGGYLCGNGSTTPTPAAGICPAGRYSLAGGTSCLVRVDSCAQSAFALACLRGRCHVRGLLCCCSCSCSCCCDGGVSWVSLTIVMFVRLFLCWLLSCRVVARASRVPPAPARRHRRQRYVLPADTASLARRRVPTAVPATRALQGRPTQHLRLRFACLVGSPWQALRRAAAVLLDTSALPPGRSWAQRRRVLRAVSRLLEPLIAPTAVLVTLAQRSRTRPRPHGRFARRAGTVSLAGRCARCAADTGCPSFFFCKRARVFRGLGCCLVVLPR